ncbi:unnamed protein product [Mytilus coruscus]|uniref:DZIP3-like HEPN domain-containing protein n=1 Tax=Mytilus coruscus TaxID=42192 RepID=A0A6J8A9J7_MYTCO|nr:unnamed protein product [Mytilus coruscus]
MTEQYRNNYFKLVAVIVDVAFLVIWKYIREKILGLDSFETFLNKEKHKLVHIYETSQCCECRIVNITGERLISRKQLLTLYKSDERNQIQDHRKYTQICICKYSAKKNIDVGVVDITLANYIIQKCGKHELGIDNWIEQIKDVRNEIFHLSDTQEMTDKKFSRKWTKLEGSIMGIAKVISSSFAVETEKHIMQTKKLTIIGDYMLKYEIICRDYWRNKCAEFESAQTQIIEEKAAALYHTMPQRFSKLMEKDCQKSMKRIETINTMVDKINVMINIFGSEENLDMFDTAELETEDNKRIIIPVFMQLDVPTSWDKTKIFEAIDEFRLNGTPDMNIRIKAISIDDLNIYAEIAKMVLCNVHEFRSEINKMMSTMLSEIDTTKHEDFCVNLKVPDMSGVSNDEYILETKKEMHKSPDSSVNHQCSTTEIDEKTPTTEGAFAHYPASVKYNLPVSVTLRQQFNIKKSKNENQIITSCIKRGNTLVFIDSGNDRLIICNSDGTDIHYIPLSYDPWYMTVVNSNTVAVSCGRDSTIMIINISTRSVTLTINTSGYCYGISYNDNNLYVVIDTRIIHLMDLTGKVIRTIPLPSDSIFDITVDRDRLVCIDVTSIYCCSLDGKLMWKFEKDKIQDLRLVTTDDEGNVYVTDINSHTVVVISDDGKHHREILTTSDGLNWPSGIYFDKKENIVLVCNHEDGKAFLFDVKKKST